VDHPAEGLPPARPVWHGQLIGEALLAGESLDLDFHSVPYFGEHPLVESHYLSKRSRRQHKCQHEQDAQFLQTLRLPPHRTFFLPLLPIRSLGHRYRFTFERRRVYRPASGARGLFEAVSE
jgi:hypothetical protein